MKGRDMAALWLRWRSAIVSLGAVASLALTHFWAYSAGANSNKALLIDTMARYRDFVGEIVENPRAACGTDGHLWGLYLAEYKSMLEVIGDELEPPYNDPCQLFLPRPPMNISIE